MEFCPEIAVFQSAFQLLASKAGTSLADIPKERCSEFVTIISTAVKEIRTGLECDLDYTQSSLWQQKLHSLVLYGLVSKKYKGKDDVESKTFSHVPVYGALDMLSQMLPEYSVQFYVELVHKCNWNYEFFKCLSYLDRESASSLLHDVLTHCTSDPVSREDEHFIAMVTEEVILRCLNAPTSHDHLIETLFAPLSQSRQYIQTVYPDTVDNVTETDQKSENQSEKIISTPYGIKINKMAGDDFLSYYLEENKELSYIILHYIDREINCIGLEFDDGENLDKLLNDMGTMSILWYLILIGNREKCVTENENWLINSLQKFDDYRPKHSGDTTIFCVNQSMAKSLAEKIPIEKVFPHVEKAISLLMTSIDNKGLGSAVIENNDIMEEDEVEYSLGALLVNCRTRESLCINSAITFRMLLGTVWEMDIRGDIYKGSESEKERLLFGMTEIRDSLEVRKQEKREDLGLLLDVSWGGDVDIMALLWRIQRRLSKFEVCMEKLLSTECLEFWKDKSVVTILMDNLDLVSYPNRVIRLLEICQHFHQTSLGEVTLRIQQLIHAAFTELCFPDQDYVAMVTYKEGYGCLMQGIVGTETARRNMTTNIFNKTTADLDNKLSAVIDSLNRQFSHQHKRKFFKCVAETIETHAIELTHITVLDYWCLQERNLILGEILVLCLADPVPVVQEAVEMCVHNSDQAHNCAMVLQHLHHICKTRYTDSADSDISIVCCVVDRFLTTNKLSDKDQKHFLEFVSTIMQSHRKDSGEVKTGILCPTEFLDKTILPCLNVQNLRHSNHPINCKFALSLLSASLEVGCNKHCDWSSFEFEPMAVVLTLAEILHECVALWDESKETADDLENSEVILKVTEGQVAMETGETRLVVKEIAMECLDKMCRMMTDGYMENNDEASLSWLLETTQDLHWTVRLRLSQVFKESGYKQYYDSWTTVFTNMASDLASNLLSVCEFLSCEVTYMDVFLTSHVTDHVITRHLVDYDDVISTLVQLLPQLLVGEFQTVMLFIKELLDVDMIPFVYRLGSTRLLPLIDLTAVKPVLGVSQILHDVIMTLTLLEGTRSQMLHHMAQSYVPLIKMCCQGDGVPNDLQCFTLSQIVQHVCDVTQCLPPAAADATLVLLLHIVTKFKVIAKATTDTKVKTVAKGKKMDESGEKSSSLKKFTNDVEIIKDEHVTEKINGKFIKNLENGMKVSISKLSNSFEEKQMLMKKLCA